MGIVLLRNNKYFYPKLTEVKNNLFKLLIFFLLFLSNKSFGQDLKTVNDKLDYEAIDKAKLKAEFARISTGNTFSTIGNFISLSSDSKTLSGSIYRVIKNGNIINFEFSGGATQGVTSIFDEGELNSNVSIGLSYSFLINKGRSAISVNASKEDVLRLQIENLNRSYQKKLLNVLDNSYKKDLDKDISKAQNSIRKLKKQDSIATSSIDSLEIISVSNPIRLKAIKKIYDSLVTKKELIRTKISDYEYLLKELKSRNNNLEDIKYSEIWNAIENEKKAKEKEIIKKIYSERPDAVSFSWISLGTGLKNNSFKLFNPELQLDEQIKGEDFNSAKAFVSYNFISNVRKVNRVNDTIINFQTKNREYFSIGLNYSYSDNLLSLQQVEVRDAKLIDQTIGREQIVRQNAFLGEYIDGIDIVTAFIDYYYFLNKDDKIALHFNPSIIIREDSKPVSSFQFGVLLPFNNLAKNKTFLNLEVFYRFKDLFNSAENDNSILNRNTIGIQASFPFNF